MIATAPAPRVSFPPSPGPNDPSGRVPAFIRHLRNLSVATHRTGIFLPGGFAAAAAFVLMTTPALAAGIGFEAKEGYAVGTDVSSQSGWTRTPGIGKITAAFANGGTQSLQLESTNSEAAIAQNIPIPADGIVFLDFAIRPVADASATPLYTIDANGARLGFVTNGDHGTVLADAGEKKPAVATGDVFTLSEGNLAADWIRITIRENIAAKTWDLFLDGKLTLVDQPLVPPKALKVAIPALSIYAPSAGNAFVDDLSLTTSNPLFPDADKDGIPDAVEVTNGTNAHYDDRSADLNADGKSNIENFREEVAIGSSQGRSGKIIYVDNRVGNDANSGEQSYVVGRSGPKLSLRAAWVQANSDTVIAIFPSMTPYQFASRLDGRSKAVTFLPLGNVTIQN